MAKKVLLLEKKKNIRLYKTAANLFVVVLKFCLPKLQHLSSLSSLNQNQKPLLASYTRVQREIWDQNIKIGAKE